MSGRRDLGRNEVIFRESVLSGVACAPKRMTRREVEAAVRGQSVAGTSDGWRVSRRRKLPDGNPHPCRCLEYPRSRVHWLVEC